MPFIHRLVFAGLFFVGVAFAQRTDTFDSGRVESLKLSPLPDGGCVAEWCGSATSKDGGVKLYDCATRELSNATNVTRCQTMLTAGEGPLLKQLRLTADAGTQ